MDHAGGAAAISLGCVALAVPFVLDPFWVSVLTLVLVYGIAATGLNLLVGYGGQISVGHGAFFALGAYTAAVLLDRIEGMPHLLALPLAGGVCFVAGLLFGVPASRLRGLHLALVTLALAVATPPLIRRFDELTGGSVGLSVVQPDAPVWLNLASDQFLYLLALAATVVMVGLARNLITGALGRDLTALRENELVASSLGVAPTRTVVGLFAVSAMYAGVAGALFAFSIGFVSPDGVGLLLSFTLLVAVVVGGAGTLAGPLIGALFIQLVPIYATDVNPGLTGVIYAVVLIAVMYVMPGGITDGILRGARSLGAVVCGSTRVGPAGVARDGFCEITKGLSPGQTAAAAPELHDRAADDAHRVRVTSDDK